MLANKQRTKTTQQTTNPKSERQATQTIYIHNNRQQQTTTKQYARKNKQAKRKHAKKTERQKHKTKHINITNETNAIYNNKLPTRNNNKESTTTKQKKTERR